MKIIIITILLASTATVSWIGFGNSDAKVIENEIQKTLQTSGAAPEQLKQLTISGKELEELDRLEDITVIEDLNLSDNQIEDLKPLGQLENLIVLDLSKNRIADLSPLSGLTKLNFLNLDQNQIGSIGTTVGHARTGGFDSDWQRSRRPQPIDGDEKSSLTLPFTRTEFNSGRF